LLPLVVFGGSESADALTRSCALAGQSLLVIPLRQTSEAIFAAVLLLSPLEVAYCNRKNIERAFLLGGLPVLLELVASTLSGRLSHKKID
jgi:hypothetical protein